MGLVLVLAGAAAIRIRLLAMPLERDEGEYAYFGQLLLSGIPPYKLAYSMKLPGVYVVNALILGVFGQTPSAIRFGLLLANGATIVLVALLGRRLWGPLAGVAAGAVFALLSMSGSVLGLAAHATHFVTLFAVAGLLALLVAQERGRGWWFFWSGVLLGFATLAKQPGVVFTAFAMLWVLWRPARDAGATLKARAARCAVLAAGAAAPLIVTAVWLGLAGVFDKFWFWTVRYAQAYGSQATLAEGQALLGLAVESFMSTAPAVWILAAASLAALLIFRTRAPETIFVAGLAVFSFLGVCPGFFFRSHYFIVLLPAVALMVGAGLRLATDALGRMARQRWLRAVAVILVGVAIAQALWADRGLFFQFSPERAARALYGANPFPEAEVLGRWIEEHSKPDDQVVVLGSEPEIYFYSRRRAATGYIYMYALMEDHPYALRMQQDLIREVETNRPTFLVFVTEPMSWLRQRGAPGVIFDWLEPYAQQNYEVIARVDLSARGPSRFIWDPQAARESPRPGPYLLLSRRRGTSGAAGPAPGK